MAPRRAPPSEVRAWAGTPAIPCDSCASRDFPAAPAAARAGGGDIVKVASFASPRGGRRGRICAAPVSLRDGSDRAVARLASRAFGRRKGAFR